jgi:hypothetical protein
LANVSLWQDRLDRRRNQYTKRCGEPRGTGARRRCGQVSCQRRRASRSKDGPTCVVRGRQARYHGTAQKHNDAMPLARWEGSWPAQGWGGVHGCMVQRRAAVSRDCCLLDWLAQGTVSRTTLAASNCWPRVWTSDSRFWGRPFATMIEGKGTATKRRQQNRAGRPAQGRAAHDQAQASKAAHAAPASAAPAARLWRPTVSRRTGSTQCTA